jgi:hypothetical protein
MTPRCAAARAGLGELLDGELSEDRARELEEHLRSCSDCRIERAGLLRTRSLLAAAGRLRAPADWIRDAVRLAEGQVPPAAPRHNRRLHDRPWVLSSIAAAAILSFVMIALRIFDTGRTPPASPPPGAPSQETVRKSLPLNDAKPDAPPNEAAPRALPHAVDESASSKKVILDRIAGKDLAAPPQAEGSTPSSIASRNEDNLPGPAPPPPVERIAFSQIHFSSQALAKDRGVVLRRDSDQMAVRAPAAQEAPRWVRIRVLLDSFSRVLSARGAEGPVDREAADLISRLPGATIDLSTREPANPSASSPSSSVREKALAPAAPPAPREIIIEFQLPPGS